MPRRWDAGGNVPSTEESGNAPGRRWCGQPALSAEASSQRHDPEIAATAACVRVEGAVPAPSPLLCTVFLQSIAGRRRAAQGVSWVGLSSRCHDVKGHVAWSGSRTRDTRINCPMLCPSELSSGDVPESNRFTSVSWRHAKRPSSRTPSPTRRHTPRQCRAHRTGHKPVPLSRVRSMLRIAGCRQPAIRVGAARPCGIQSPRRSRRSITTQRTCAGRSRAPASGRADALPGCSRAERNFRGGMERTWSMHAHPPRTLKTKRPRGLRPEGVRVPREIGVADLPGSQPDVRCPGAAPLRCRAWHRRHRHARAGRSAMAAGQACRWRGGWVSWRSMW